MFELFDECPECKGKGRWVETEDDGQMVETVTKVCEACGGTGRVIEPDGDVD